MNELDLFVDRLKAPDFPTRRNAAEALGEMADARAIVPLLKLLGDDYWQVRNTVVEALVKIRDRSSIAPLLECLRDEDPGIRNSAMSVLDDMGEDVAGPLARLLKNDPAEDVRIFSANTLGRLRTSAGIPGLIEGLSDADENVRYACAEGLGRQGNPAAVHALVRAMDREETWSRFPYIAALGLIGDERACAALIPLLDDEVLSFPAATALGQIGDIAALYPLLDLLKKTGDAAVTRSCIVSLARIEETAGHFAKVEREGFQHTRVLEELKKLASPAIMDMLVSMAHSTDEAESSASLNLLKKTGGKVPVERLFGLLENELIEDAVRDIIVRQGKPALKPALEALAKGDADNAVQLLRIIALLGTEREAAAAERFLSSPEPETAGEALKCLGMINAAKSLDRMASFFSSPDEQVRNAAVGGIALLKETPAMVAKITGILSSPDPLQRRGACRVLGFLSTEKSAGLLAGNLHDVSPAVRAAAVQSLGYVGAHQRSVMENPVWRDALSRVVLDEDPAVRIEGALAFSRIASPSAAALLMEMLGDAHPAVRGHAIRSAGRCRLRAAEPALLRLLTREEDPEQKIFIVHALAGCGGEASLPALKNLLNDPVPEVAAEAVRAISKAGGPAVKGLVVPLLNAPSWITREAAVTALGELGGGSVAGILGAFLDGMGEETVCRLLTRAAVRAIGKTGGPSELSRIAGRLSVADCRYEAFEAAREICLRHAIAPEAAIGSPPAARRFFMTIIGQTRPAGAEGMLVAALDDEYPTVKRAAALALRGLGTRGGWRERAKNDTDSWVRAIAE